MYKLQFKCIEKSCDHLGAATVTMATRELLKRRSTRQTSWPVRLA